MKKIMFLIILIFPLGGFSQTPTSTPTSTPAPTTQPQPQPNPVPAQRRQIGSLSKAEEDIALNEEQRVKAERHKLAREMVDELYRKPTKKEILLVSIDNGLHNKFAEFLKQENTGLFKFLNDSKCSVNSNIISASEDCLKNKMPGAGASYSFRTNNYRIPQLADLSFAKNMFITVGQWMHGLLLDIGDIPLEKVTLQTAEVENLSKFQPASNIETAKEIDSKLNEGIKHEKIIYQRLLPARENTTYLLRSIAYRGVVSKTAQGFVYNELDYDKRKDILVAFRIVQTDSNGSIIILWKQLALKDSPKIVQQD